MTQIRHDKEPHPLFSRVVCHDCRTVLSEGRQPEIAGLCRPCLTKRQAGWEQQQREMARRKEAAAAR